MFSQTPTPDWLNNSPPVGQEARWMKERSQTNRRHRLTPPKRQEPVRCHTGSILSLIQ
jgi:hypothetical protein